MLIADLGLGLSLAFEDAQAGSDFAAAIAKAKVVKKEYVDNKQIYVRDDADRNNHQPVTLNLGVKYVYREDLEKHQADQEADKSDSAEPQKNEDLTLEDIDEEGNPTFGGVSL